MNSSQTSKLLNLLKKFAVGNEISTKIRFYVTANIKNLTERRIDEVEFTRRVKKRVDSTEPYKGVKAHEDDPRTEI